MNSVQKYLLHLLKCAVSNEKADSIPDNISLAELFAYAKEEQVENLAYIALPPTEREPEIMRKFSQCYEKAIVRESKQELELSMISDALTSAGIKHVPLKGSVVKHMYPSPDLRQSGDIDILTDTSDGTDEIMNTLGFTAARGNSLKHHSYERGKIRVEMHSMLSFNSPVFCDRVWDNVRNINGQRYEMTPEFLYVYLLLHLHTHLLQGGAGIKLILDFYVFNRKIQADREKISTFAKEAGLYNLMHYTETLAASWFDGISYNDENISVMEELVLDTPVYGSFETSVKINCNSVSKIRNFIKIIFLPYNRMVTGYPVLKKFPVLLPVMWVRRIIRRLFASDNHIQIITDTLSSASNEDIEKYMAFKDSISK